MEEQKKEIKEERKEERKEEIKEAIKEAIKEERENHRGKERNQLEGKNILLRPMTLEDTELIIHWRNQPHVRKNFIYQEPFTVEGHHQWIRSMMETGKGVQFILCEKQKDCRPIGSVYLRDIDYSNSKAEYGIFIGEKEVWGKGYGTEAALLMTEYAFHTLKLHKVFLRFLAENKGAAASYQKAGFIREAYFKEEVRINGIFRDIVFMAKMFEEDGE